jgi:ZIP family zinc transporter
MEGEPLLIDTSIMFYSMMAGLATVLGSFLVLAWNFTKGFLAFFLGLAAGIMAAVVLLDLIPAAVRYGNLITILIGTCLGVFLLLGFNWLLSCFAPSSRKVTDRKYLLKMGYLTAAGIALHDLPEGMAIAAGWAAAQNLGLMLVLSIGLHNVPEGMATATFLKMAGVAKIRILALIFSLTLCTPLGTLLGLLLVSLSQVWIGFLLALAAGAMTYIVVFGLVPEAFRRQQKLAALGLLMGLAIFNLLVFFREFVFALTSWLLVMVY